MGWVDLSTLYVKKSGDTMTGSLTVPASSSLVCYNGTTEYNVGATLQSLQDSVSSLSVEGDYQYLYNHASYGYVRYRVLGKDWVELNVFVTKASADHWYVETQIPSAFRPRSTQIWPALRTTSQGVPTNNVAFVELDTAGNIKIQPLSYLDEGCVEGVFIYFIKH